MKEARELLKMAKELTGGRVFDVDIRKGRDSVDVTAYLEGRDVRDTTQQMKKLMGQLSRVVEPMGWKVSSNLNVTGPNEAMFRVVKAGKSADSIVQAVRKVLRVR